MTREPLHLTLLRHGRSRADDERVHEGRYDSPLTDIGRAQARARAEGWKREGRIFDVIVSSTLSRAMATAQIVGQLLGVEIHPHPRKRGQPRRAWVVVEDGIDLDALLEHVRARATSDEL